MLNRLVPGPTGSIRLPIGQTRAALLIGQVHREDGIGINGVLGLGSNDPGNPTGNANFSNPADVEREAYIRVELLGAGAVHLLVSIDGRKQTDWSGNEADI